MRDRSLLPRLARPDLTLKLRAAMAAKPDDRRLLNMRAHRTAFLMARKRRWSPGAIALAGRCPIEAAQ